MQLKEKITKQDFAAYRKVQQLGVTNMLDVEKISTLSNLTREKILDIMKSYSYYAKKWNFA